ncbi:uncharacterized protein RCC_05088 [Ramularia collo-cygni]|uniref:Uncharacterized protein n=1 Tax=Ramularia collo-cygni TaxID=112498 RepID=A0A2D3UQN0_9PEZI|nr:uncharacterized protein RCC_05088 [Ramularia collo-cygni]CZT19242.1 uncharacterized protein RCC_05088 [Ramularia collo-cygni]
MDGTSDSRKFSSDGPFPLYPQQVQFNKFTRRQRSLLAKNAPKSRPHDLPDRIQKFHFTDLPLKLQIVLIMIPEDDFCKSRPDLMPPVCNFNFEDDQAGPYYYRWQGIYSKKLQQACPQYFLPTGPIIGWWDVGLVWGDTQSLSIMQGFADTSFPRALEDLSGKILPIGHPRQRPAIHFNLAIENVPRITFSSLVNFAFLFATHGLIAHTTVVMEWSYEAEINEFGEDSHLELHLRLPELFDTLSMIGRKWYANRNARIEQDRRAEATSRSSGPAPWDLAPTTAARMKAPNLGGGNRLKFARFVWSELLACGEKDTIQGKFILNGLGQLSPHIFDFLHSSADRALKSETKWTSPADSDIDMSDQ